MLRKYILLVNLLWALNHIQIRITETIVCKLIDQISHDVYICPEISISVTKALNRGQGTLFIKSNGNALIDLHSFPALKLDLEAETYVLHLKEIYLVPEVTYAQILLKLGATQADFHEIIVEKCIYFSLHQIRDFNELVTLNFMDLYNSGLNHHLSQYFPKLRTLIMNNNSFTEAPSLKGLYQLEEYFLESTQIRELPDEYFSDNSQLKVVSIGNIYKNILNRVSKNLFRHLYELQFLTLDANIHELPILTEQSKLKELRLRLSSEHKILPSHTFQHMTHLKILKLFNSGIYKLESDVFKQNYALKELQLQGNYIEELPYNIFDGNQDLSILNLGMNKIQEFNDSILPAQLEMFGLNSNPVKVYNMFTRLPDLTSIDFNSMQLSGVLYLQHLSDFYPSLMMIRFSDNHIEKFIIELSATFISHELQIDLSRNRISTIELITDDGLEGRNWFNWRTRLKINLKGNPIKCECSMKPFLQYLRSEMNEYIYLVNDVGCDGFESQTLLTIDLEQIIC